MTQTGNTDKSVMCPITGKNVLMSSTALWLWQTRFRVPLPPFLLLSSHASSRPQAPGLCIRRWAFPTQLQPPTQVLYRQVWALPEASPGSPRHSWPLSPLRTSHLFQLLLPLRSFFTKPQVCSEGLVNISFSQDAARHGCTDPACAGCMERFGSVG